VQSVCSSICSDSHRSCGDPFFSNQVEAIRLGELHTVLPELAQIDAILQRLVKNKKSKVLADVVVLQQLCWSPFKGLGGHGIVWW
jgi:hypothetical protein